MNTAEHQERRRQGKPQWRYTVRGFRDVLDDYHHVGLIETRDRLVSLIRASQWYKQSDSDQLAEIVDELADVGHREIDWDDGYSAERHFDDCLSSIYDEADWDRAWLA